MQLRAVGQDGTLRMAGWEACRGIRDSECSLLVNHDITTRARIGATDVCGDFICGVQETQTGCPADCGAAVPASCGDGVCGGQEDCGNCPLDCTICTAYPAAARP
jgi:hypothetical protein